MWAAGVVVLEMYAGGLTGLPLGWGENALDLLETLARNTTGLSNSGEGSGGNASSIGKDPEQPQSRVAGGLERSAQGSGSPKGRGAFRVDMPEAVVSILRDIFQKKAEDRPESMEVRCCCGESLCRALNVLLHRGGALNIIIASYTPAKFRVNVVHVKRTFCQFPSQM